MKISWRGVFPAVTTQFKDDYAVDAEATRRSIQALLRAMNFSKDAPDGKAGPATRTAIREYERAAGLKETGEPTQALLDSLREMSGLLKR